MSFLKNLLLKILTNKGLTVNSHCNEITFNSGYIVAESGTTIDTSLYGFSDLVDKLGEAINEIYVDNCKIGFWLDNDTIYVDIVHHYEDFKTAKFFGLQWDQKAIFNCTTKQEIFFPFN